MINLILGILISYNLYKNICNINFNQCPNTRINHFGKLHIHHWIIHSILLIIVLYFKLNLFIRGLNIGGIIHGLSEYNDWYVIYH